jgi:hypothetical protein
MRGLYQIPEFPEESPAESGDSIHEFWSLSAGSVTGGEDLEDFIRYFMLVSINRFPGVPNTYKLGRSIQFMKEMLIVVNGEVRLSL